MAEVDEGPPRPEIEKDEGSQSRKSGGENNWGLIWMEAESEKFGEKNLGLSEFRSHSDLKFWQ